MKYNKENSKVRKLPEQVDILRLWIDHSQTPVDDTYGYVVYAGENVPAMELPFKVLRNDTLVQAASNKDGSMLEAVFYQGGAKLKEGETLLSVSAPCVLLIERTETGNRLSINDPVMNQNLKEIVVSYNGRTIPVKMPQGAFCGKPVTVNM